MVSENWFGVREKSGNFFFILIKGNPGLGSDWYFFIASTLLLLLQINAMANKAAGKGYESTDFYENVKFQFVGIENIHVMRQSLQKMMECKYNLLTLS